MTTYDTPVRAPLRRPTEGRVLGGVAARLSRHGGVDPLAVRIAFVVVPLALVPYVLAWILVPSDAEPQGRESRRGRAALVAGAAFLAAGALLAPDRADPAWLGVDGRWIAPILLGVTGLALLVRGARD